MENDPILITYKSCSIKQSDIDCLSDYQYLNDLIISFYYEILNEKYIRNDIVLLDPAVSMSIIFDQDLDDINNCIFQPLGMKDKKFIFVPINDNTKIEYKTSGSHWALNIIDVNSNTIYYLDSMSSNISNAKISVRKFQKLFGKKFNFVYALEKTYQTNSSDCGMFILGFTETILKYLKEKNFNSNALNNIKFDDILQDSEKVKQNNMPSFRKEIKNIIYKLIKNKK